jgi:hypothetical protein
LICELIRSRDDAKLSYPKVDVQKVAQKAKARNQQQHITVQRREVHTFLRGFSENEAESAIQNNNVTGSNFPKNGIVSAKRNVLASEFKADQLSGSQRVLLARIHSATAFGLTIIRRHFAIYFLPHEGSLR